MQEIVNSGSTLHPPCLTVVPLYCTTAATHLLTTSSCLLCHFPPLVVSTAQHGKQSVNQSSQTTKRQPMIDSPTNQSSINHQSL